MGEGGKDGEKGGEGGNIEWMFGRRAVITNDGDYIFLMKKRSCSSHGSDKSAEGRSSRKDKKQKFVAFDYSNNKLQCFITSSTQNLSKAPRKCDQVKTNPTLLAPKASHEKTSPLSQLRVPRKNRGRLTSNSKNAFNNTLLLLEYEGEEEVRQDLKPDSTQRPKEGSEQEDQVITAIVNSCMRVITEDTEHSSNPISARFAQQSPSAEMPMMMQMTPEDYYYYMQRPPAMRNRRAISMQESKAYVIDVNKVEWDGRTTIMVRNIPNKYTQEMLLEVFEQYHKKKFDFFYLPIDYNNNCNVGYAFLNFIHTKFIVDFYYQFHSRKWNKFNSVKVCQVCYARIQGTAQLEHHFEHSNVLQQRERRFRPLFENITSLVERQKEHAEEQPEEP